MSEAGSSPSAAAARDRGPGRGVVPRPGGGGWTPAPGRTAPTLVDRVNDAINQVVNMYSPAATSGMEGTQVADGAAQAMQSLAVVLGELSATAAGVAARRGLPESAAQGLRRTAKQLVISAKQSEALALQAEAAVPDSNVSVPRTKRIPSVQGVRAGVRDETFAVPSSVDTRTVQGLVTVLDHIGAATDRAIGRLNTFPHALRYDPTREGNYADTGTTEDSRISELLETFEMLAVNLDRSTRELNISLPEADRAQIGTLGVDTTDIWAEPS